MTTTAKLLPDYEALWGVKDYPYCDHCYRSDKGGYEIHHIIFRSEAPEHEDLHHPQNLILVCRDCHNLFHGRKHYRDPYIAARKLWKLFTFLNPLNYDNETINGASGEDPNALPWD